jgi:hypothetical protein
MQETWEFLVLNVTYNNENGDIVDFASSNHEYVLSNVPKDELYLYVKELEKNGWQLETVHSEDKAHESYHFKRLRE